MVMTMGTYQRSGDDVLQQQWGVPIGIAPSATWNNTSGNFTLDTALNQVYRNGLWLRFVGVGVNSSTGGPATTGLYWCVMNSTTEGQAYAFPNITISTTVPVITGNTAFIPFIPLASQLAGLLPVTAGSHSPLASGTYYPVANVTIPGGLMGANGAIRTDFVFNTNNSAGSKAAAPSFANVAFFGQSVSSTSITGVCTGMIRNRGLTNSQVSSPLANTSSTLGLNFATIDTTVDQLAGVYLNITTANTDWIILQGGTIEILPAS